MNLIYPELRSLSQGSYMQYYSELAYHLDIYSAVMLGALIKKATGLDAFSKMPDDGWFFYKVEEAILDTGLSGKLQAKGLKMLEKIGMISIKRRGIPSIRYFRVNSNVYKNFLENPSDSHWEDQVTSKSNVSQYFPTGRTSQEKQESQHEPNGKDIITYSKLHTKELHILKEKNIKKEILPASDQPIQKVGVQLTINGSPESLETTDQKVPVETPLKNVPLPAKPKSWKLPKSMDNKLHDEQVKYRKKQGYLDFDSFFWTTYGKKGDRKDCEKRWYGISECKTVGEKSGALITPEIQLKIVAMLPSYLGSISDEQYKRNGQTFFNKETWRNEYKTPEKSYNKFIDKKQLKGNSWDVLKQ